ncbi:hypothetical protein ACHAXM_009927 [Skeletonema potamos]
MTTIKCKTASLVEMLLLISSSSLTTPHVSLAFQQCPSQHIIVSSGGSHLHRRRKNRCVVHPSALQSSFGNNDFDDFDEFDTFDEWDDGRRQQYNNNNNPWDMYENLAAQFPPPPPPPPPYDRPTYSSNLRETIASSTPSPYDNPSWTKSSRYGNPNVNFNSRSNRNINTLTTRSDGDPYKLTTGYGRETYRNSAPNPDYEYNYQSQYKGYPSRTTYSQDDNYAGRRRWEDTNNSRSRKKLYRDYDDVDNDPNSSNSRGKGGNDRFSSSSSNNNNVDFSPRPPPQYRNYNDPSDAPNRSYRASTSGRSNGLPPPPQYRDYDDINTEPNRSYRDDSTMGPGRNNFSPRPPQYRDYDDVNTAPSRSYGRDEGSSNNNFPPRSSSNSNSSNNNNKFPPRRPPQSIPNNFASPQSNRGDSPPNNFPPGVGGMGYNPPSEYIPQNKRGPQASSTWSNSFRRNPSSRMNSNYYNTFNDRNPSNERNPPRSWPPPPFNPQYNNNNSNFNDDDNQKYQYDVNRREKYIDNELLNRGQTLYNFPNGEVIRKERINTLKPTGFNSIFSDMFTPFQQMFKSAEQSLKSSDMLKEARLRILDNEVVLTKLGEPLQVSPPFSQSSSMSSVNGKKASKVRARFQVGGPYGTGVATMDSVDGEIRSLVVDVNGSTVRIGPREKGGRRRKNVVEAEIIDEGRLEDRMD